MPMVHRCLRAGDLESTAASIAELANLVRDARNSLAIHEFGSASDSRSYYQSGVDRVRSAAERARSLAAALDRLAE